MNIIVAVTAASGAIYARQILETVCQDPRIDSVALICSASSREVALSEGVALPQTGGKIVEYDNSDMFVSVASGSSEWDSMIIVPCSVGTVGRIATGVSDSLICRAADVMLKERRKMVLVVREMPYSLIHLRNMTTLTESGAIVLPASPSYYMGANDIETLAMSVSSRALALAGLDGYINHYEGKKRGK